MEDNSYNLDKAWDFWYDDEKEKFYILYEKLMNNDVELILAERDILE